MGLRFLSAFLNERLPAMLGMERVAGSKGRRARQVGTSLGEVTLRRAYVPGRGCPLDEALGLVDGFTPEAASMLCVAGSMSESYDKGEGALKKLSGLSVPGRAIQRLVNDVSPQMEADGADRRQGGFAPATAVVNTQLDMTGVPMRPEDLAQTRGKDGDPRKRQLKAAVSFRQTLGSDGKPAVEKSSIGHLVAFEDKERFGERLNYFRVNERRMRYGEFRRKGYVIGSGAVEGACRSVINQRADLSGQRWHPDGALNVLRIRGMVMDGIHEDYWKRRGTVRHLEVA